MVSKFFAKRAKIKPHPGTCPNCNGDKVVYERFTRIKGEYVCDDCGWGMDAVTGEIIFGEETLKKAKYSMRTPQRCR